MKISVVTPIYNARKYIERCVRSLMEQTVTDDIEFIFVNDRTPDDSMEVLGRVLSDYPKRKDQVRIINNEKNLGPSDSRKVAIMAANGEYIACCDADDWVEPTMYEKLYQASKKGLIDIVVGDYEYYKEGRNVQEKSHFNQSSTPQECLSHLDQMNRFPYAMWCLIAKTRIVREQIKYIVPTKIREDTFLLMRVFYYSTSISFVPEVFYHYWVNNSASLIHNRLYTAVEWEKQKANIEKISKMLYGEIGGYELYHRALNRFKFGVKLEYKDVFVDDKSFYYAFRECHKDGVEKYNLRNSSSLVKLRMKIAYLTCYPIYKLYRLLA